MRSTKKTDTTLPLFSPRVDFNDQSLDQTFGRQDAVGHDWWMDLKKLHEEVGRLRGRFERGETLKAHNIETLFDYIHELELFAGIESEIEQDR